MTAPERSIAHVGAGRGVEVLVLHLDDRRLAFPLDSVVEVLPAMASQPLHQAPAVIEGVVNLHGDPVPMLDLRVRLGLPTRAAHPDDHVVVCRVAGRHIGIRVDAAELVTRLSRQDITPAAEVAVAPHLAGVAVVADDLVLVYDVRSFLGTDEALSLDAAMAARVEESA